MESVLKEGEKRAARAKYILVHFIPSVQDNGQKSSNERFWPPHQSFFSPLLRQQRVHLFYISKWTTHGQGGKISRDLFNAIASFDAAKIKDHESIQSVRASRGVTSTKTSLQNRTRISCILYLLYPSSKTREKNTCQPFAYKTYLNIKGRFIYF